MNPFRLAVLRAGLACVRLTAHLFVLDAGSRSE